MKKWIAALACAAAVAPLGIIVPAQAQDATSYNNYGYDSYASQMVRDHIN